MPLAPPALSGGDGIGSEPPPAVSSLISSTFFDLRVLGGPGLASMEGTEPAGGGGMGMVVPYGDSGREGVTISITGDSEKDVEVYSDGENRICAPSCE